MAKIGKQDLHEKFYAYGEIADIKVMPEKRCAIVTYVLRKSAEEAASGLYKKLRVNGVSLKLWWAKGQSGGGGGGGGRGGGQYAPPPPGSLPPPGQPGRTLYPSMDPSSMGARPDRG